MAIELPEAIRDALTGLQEKLREYGFRASWTRPENIHLTLKFIGDTAVSRIDSISGQMAAVAREQGPITLFARSVGVFPGARRARVLWTGIGGAIDRLGILKVDLEDGLATVGCVRDDKRFAGHLTLARFKGAADPDRVVSMMEQFGGFASEPFTADAIHLFESRLSPGGAVYTKLASCRLGGGPET